MSRGEEPGKRWYVFSIVVAWLPFIWMISYFVPKYEPVLAGLRQKGELPIPTEWILKLASINTGTWFIPCFMLIGLLIISSTITNPPYWRFVILNTVVAMLAAAFVVWALAISSSGPTTI